MEIINGNKEQFASKVPSINKRQKEFIEYGYADLPDADLTPNQNVKQFRQVYDPVDLFCIEIW